MTRRDSSRCRSPSGTSFPCLGRHSGGLKGRHLRVRQSLLLSSERGYDSRPLIHSPSEHQGRDLVERLNHFLRAYYWWFEDMGVENYIPREECPVCRNTLSEVEGREFKKCDSCSILAW